MIRRGFRRVVVVAFSVVAAVVVVGTYFDFVTVQQRGTLPGKDVVVVVNHTTTTNDDDDDDDDTTRTCRRTPWTDACVAWYNTGHWTVVGDSRRRPWNATFGYHSWDTATATTPERCQQVGTTYQWQSSSLSSSSHKNPPVFEAKQFFQALGRDASVLFVGDSLMRQWFAVFLEAIGIPRESCTMEQIRVHIGRKRSVPFPVVCQHDAYNVTLRMHNQHYADSQKPTQWPQFDQTDVIIWNVGVWYVENQKIGRKTGHTPNTYLSHMAALLQQLQVHRRPHQLIIFRESTAMLNPTSDLLRNLTLQLRPLLVQGHIPVIRWYDDRDDRTDNDDRLLGSQPIHNNINVTTWTPTATDLFRDAVHFCEPALQLAWSTVLMHVVRDWSAARKKEEESSAAAQ